MQEQAPKNHSKKLIEVAMLFCVIFSLSVLVGSTLLHAEAPAKAENIRSRPMLEGIEIEAKAAYAFDLETRDVLFAKNETEALPLASLTKIMTAVTALRTIAPDTEVSISKSDMDEIGDNKLKLGEKWKIQDLLQFALIASSNDAASAIATAFESLAGRSFLDEMNGTATELGFDEMYFQNETGLDFDTSSNGGYGSARDVARLMSYAMENHAEIFEATSLLEQNFTTVDGGFHTAYNTNKSLVTLPGNPLMSKTGFTWLSGGNVAVIFEAENGHPIALVVLGSSKEGRFSDLNILAEATANLEMSQ